MKISFENTFLDIWKFNCSHQFRNVATQAVYILGGLAIFSIIYQYEIDGVKQNSLLASFFIAGVFYLFMWIFQLVFNLFSLYSKSNKSVLTQHTVEIQDEALFEETKYNRSYFYWNGIEKILQAAGFIAVYVTAHTAILIPRRSFKSVELKNKFYESLLEKKKQSSRNT